MRRFPLMAGLLVVKGFLVIKAGFFVGAVGLSAALPPILLNSCRNVQPEEATSERGAAGAEAAASGPGASGAALETPPAGATEPAAAPGTTGRNVQGTTARQELSGVTTAASDADEGLRDTPGAPQRISAGTRRTARGLSAEIAGYASWNVLEDPEGVVAPPGVDGECRAYIHLPLEVEATIGERLELPFERGTMIVIESKHARDDFIRRVDTLERGELGWELRCFVREQPAAGFEEEPPESHPDDAPCRRLLASIEKETAALILGE